MVSELLNFKKWSWFTFISSELYSPFGHQHKSRSFNFCFAKNKPLVWKSKRFKKLLMKNHKYATVLNLVLLKKHVQKAHARRMKIDMATSWNQHVLPFSIFICVFSLLPTSPYMIWPAHQSSRDNIKLTTKWFPVPPMHELHCCQYHMIWGEI